jgi:hypothetical protein
MSSTILERAGRHALTAPDGPPPAARPAGAPAGRRALTATRTMTVLRIDLDGGMELVELRANRDGIADAVEGLHFDDVTARFCFPMSGAGCITFWQADSADDRVQAVNRVAVDLLERFLPRPGDGVYDRDRTVLERKPVAGVVVVAGYDQELREPTDLPDVALDRFRAALDGRDAARAIARENTAETEPLPALEAVEDVER